MGLFRPEALRRAQSPEELDALLQVTSPGMWLTLGALALLVGLALAWALFASVPVTVAGQGLVLPQGGLVAVAAPRSGTVTAVDTAPGQALAPGDPVAELQTGSGPATATSLAGGRTAEVLVAPGGMVAAGQVLAWVDPSGGALTVSAYVPLGAAAAVHPGQSVQVVPAGGPAPAAGYVEGQVAAVASYPATRTGMAAALGDAQLAAALAAAGDRLAVQVALQADPSEPGGLRWSNGGRSAPALGVGSPVDVSIVIAAIHPVRYVFAGA